MSKKYCSAGQGEKWIVVLLVLSLCVGCTFRKVPKSLLATKSQSPDIRGVITDLYSTDGRPHAVHVRGVLEDDTKYDEAGVSLSDRTRVFRMNGNQYEMVTFQELKKGQIVEVIFIPGEILEKHPIVGEAQEILIISQGE